MKSIVQMGLLAVILITAAVLWFEVAQSLHPPQGPQSHHTGPTIEMVQQLASLVTTRVTIADAQETKITGYTGVVKAVLIVRGDYLLEVDLSTAKFTERDTQRRTAVLLLPPPRVTSPRVDHERTRLLWVTESGLWAIAPGNSGQVAAVNAAFGEAQRMVARAAAEESLVQGARRQAEHVLGTFFSALGWKVNVQWADQAGAERRKDDDNHGRGKARSDMASGIPAVADRDGGVRHGDTAADCRGLLVDVGPGRVGSGVAEGINWPWSQGASRTGYGCWLV